MTAAAGGASFPLLGAAYERGAGALNEIPRWAARALAVTSARAAASIVLATWEQGPHRASWSHPTISGRRPSRPVVAALAASLLPPSTAPAASTTALYPLALAIAAAGHLDDDRLARLLQTASTAWQPPSTWPTIEQLRELRALVVSFEPAAAARLLAEAATSSTGPERLSTAARLAVDVNLDRAGRLPVNLDALVAHLRSFLPADPVPNRPAVRPRPSVARPAAALPTSARAGAALPVTRATRRLAAQAAPATATRAAAPALPDMALAPPRSATALPLDSAAALRHSPAMRAVDGLVVGTLRLVLPRTLNELTEWGSRLENCLGTYGAAAHSGRSRLIGIEHDDRLIGCIEINPSGGVRQFLGQRNRAMTRSIARPVCQALAEAGIVDRSRPGNQVWFAG
ncbi:MAG: PcfJ domain-containing protein [Acidimicrobiales bacterium]